MHLSNFIIVEQTTDKPAEDTIVAARLSGELNAGAALHSKVSCIRIRDEKGEFSQIGHKDYVTGFGTLTGNGFLWIERALGECLDPFADEVLHSRVDAKTPQVICLNYNLFKKWDRDTLHKSIEKRAPGALWVRVKKVGDQFMCQFAQDALSDGIEMGTVIQNTYLHPMSEFSKDIIGQIIAHLGLEFDYSLLRSKKLSWLKPVEQFLDLQPKIVIIGEEDHLRCVYPAVLTSLGDSALELGVKCSLEILSAKKVLSSEGQKMIKSADGVLLPGGSDMAQPEGQVQAAILTLDEKIPTMGQCLGMQSLVVAVARYRAGLAGAGLEEVHPKAPILAFRRMVDRDQNTIHRLGSHNSVIESQTLLHRIFKKDVIRQRMNHRYQLNPEIIPALEKAGIRISARSSDHRIVDGVEFSDHPFFMGLGGHPELSSRPKAANPFISEFVRQAIAHQENLQMDSRNKNSNI